MKNVLIENAHTPAGQRVALLLSERGEVERLVGVEPALSAHWSSEMELVSIEPDHRAQLELIHECQIDTVIQCGLAPNRSGAKVGSSEADVVGTMRLGAAIGHHESPVRSWVIVSSSSAYPKDSNRPLLNREASKLVPSDNLAHGSLIEAEDYARDVARRAPHLNVAILRMQELIGDGIHGPLSAHFDQRLVPIVFGHDPAIQFLHIEDAAAAVCFAADLELAGVYNVASRGVIRLHDFLSVAQRKSIGLPPLGAGPLAPLASVLGLPFIPDELVDHLRFGHAIDGGKIEAAGFKPTADQYDCAEVLKNR